MRFDVISAGSAAVDLFFHSTEAEIARHHGHTDVCLPLGAKLLVDRHAMDVGGSGVNTSIAFSRLGLRAAMIGKIGSDPHGHFVLERLAKEGVHFLGKTGSGQTGCSAILSQHPNRTILAFKGINDQFSLKDIKTLDTHWLYLGTFLGKGWDTLCAIAKHAKKNNTHILFNPSQYLAERGAPALRPVLSATHILICNKEEAQLLTKKNDAIPDLLQTLAEQIPVVVITDGAKGAFASNGIRTYSITPSHVKVIEPTGAGDAFASGFLAAIMLHHDIPSALRWGAAQANSVIQHIGATNILLNRKQIGINAKRSGRVEET